MICTVDNIWINVLVERSGDDEVRYVYGNGLIGSYSDDDFTTHHYDLRGSTVSVSNESGDVIGNVEYDEYGVVMSKDDTVDTRFLYNGQFGVQTDDNGLYHMRARYYNPEIKRFMNRDVVAGSIAEPQTLNRYAYVNGDPVSYHDPFGLAREMLNRDNVQMTLDFAGMAPGIGALADLTNAGIYAWNGDWGNAGFSVLAAIPGYGDAAGAAKISSNSLKIVDNAADYGKVRKNKKLSVSEDPYQRPSGFRKGVRDSVFAKAKQSDGKVYDSQSGMEILPDAAWDMGHKAGYEFKKHRRSAQERSISRKQFLDEHNNVDHYVPELPSSNRNHKDEAPDDVDFWRALK